MCVRCENRRQLYITSQFILMCTNIKCAAQLLICFPVTFSGFIRVVKLCRLQFPRRFFREVLEMDSLRALTVVMLILHNVGNLVPQTYQIYKSFPQTGIADLDQMGIHDERSCIMMTKFLNYLPKPLDMIYIFSFLSAELISSTTSLCSWYRCEQSCLVSHCTKYLNMYCMSVRGCIISVFCMFLLLCFSSTLQLLKYKPSLLRY